MKRLFPMLLCLLAAQTLSAQSVEMRGGVMAGLSMPGGDLKDKRELGTNNALGVHVGGHLGFQLDRHHELRAHLTLIKMPGSQWDSWTNDYSMTQVGGDWVYNFESPNRGLYTVAGLAFTQIKVEAESDHFYDNASQSGKIALRGGLGYSFNRLFSLEGTLNHVSVEKNGSDGFGFDTGLWLQVSAVWRFGGR